MTIKVLDSGYVKLIESWGSGEAKVPEAGIIEAAKQSTQGSFRGWDIWHCNDCGLNFEGKVKHYHIKDDGSQEWVLPKNWSNDEKLLKYMFTNNHATPFEFCGMVIEVQAPIFVFREWHRHRTQSYNEMSARYAPLPDVNYMPTFDRIMNGGDQQNKQAGLAKGATALIDGELAAGWLEEVQYFYEGAQDLYLQGLDMGVPKEVARIVLPVGRYSRMRASANLRNWIGFLTLRMDPKAQYEIRQFANAVGTIVQQEFPKTWDLFVGKEE